MKRILALLLLAAALGPGETTIFIPLLVHDQSLVVEVADTAAKQVLGLMHRENLGDDRGMLFVYENEETRTFWMKNTRLSLDLVFINAQHQVVDLLANVPPCRQDPCPTYSGAFPAQYVLEIRGGRAAALNLHIGDAVFFTWPRPKN